MREEYDKVNKNGALSVFLGQVNARDVKGKHVTAWGKEAQCHTMQSLEEDMKRLTEWDKPLFFLFVKENKIQISKD